MTSPRPTSDQARGTTTAELRNRSMNSRLFAAAPARKAPLGKARAMTYTVGDALFMRQRLKPSPDVSYVTGLEYDFTCRHSLERYWPFGSWTIWVGGTCVGRLLSCPSYTDCLAALAQWRRERGGTTLSHAMTTAKLPATATMTVAEALTESEAGEEEDEPIIQDQNNTTDIDEEAA
jgi:hypothetical protein